MTVKQAEHHITATYNGHLLKTMEKVKLLLDLDPGLTRDEAIALVFSVRYFREQELRVFGIID